MKFRGELLFFIALLCSINFASSTVWYMDPYGNDTTGNGSISRPFATLDRAAQMVQPGDTIYMNPGMYYPTQGIIIYRTGRADAWITLRSNGNAIFNGSNMSAARRAILELSRYGYYANHSMYWIIDGIKFMNSPRAGMRFNHVDYVIINNSEAGFNNDWGYFSGHSNYLQFTNVDAHDTRTQHGLYLSNSGDNYLIENSRFYRNAGCGIHHNGDLSMDDGDGVVIDGIITNSTIRNNTIWDNGNPGGGSGINLDGVMDSKIYNNLLYNNYANGIASFITDGAAAGNNLIAHNTIYQRQGSGRYGFAIKGSVNNTIINNIVVGGVNSVIQITSESLSQNLVDYNLYASSLTAPFSNEDTGSYPMRNWIQYTGWEQNSIFLSNWSNLFVDASNLNFELKNGSAAIDNGTSSVISFDRKGITRPQGIAFDMGAYEFVSSLNQTQNQTNQTNQTVYHEADLNQNSYIETSEIMNYISRFKTGNVTRTDVLIGVRNWLLGRYN